MYSLLKAGCVGLDMSDTGLSKAERNLKSADSFVNSNQSMRTIMLFLPCF